jgi:two-component system cell cycle response regulator DivK
MSKTVLIVEDVADIRTIMKLLLESYGYQTITADDGYEAFEKFQKYQPDLVLMDLMMPVLDGLDATRIIRQVADPKTPILAVTAYPKRYHKKALEAGCNAVVPKPIDFANFKSFLQQFLS